MSFEMPITIATALDRIHRREYVLPAIQREFVWSRDKITRLFDSLMRGYPIGSFLMWHVDATKGRIRAGHMGDHHVGRADRAARLRIMPSASGDAPRALIARTRAWPHQNRGGDARRGQSTWSRPAVLHAAVSAASRAPSACLASRTLAATIAASASG
ncbi:hypothetical protein MLGJGCBP_10166 [Rhodococcus sp. T7]|nr:hypothetical protein MLGJGCBP_10166 [Rhodococcus sp. T7]